jgi:hypothetical protein
MNEIFEDAAEIRLLNTEDAMTVAEHPASGSFIDVAKFERFAFLVGAGALDSATTLQVHQATAVDGATKDVTGATLVIAADGDDKWYLIEVQTNKLDINNDYHFVTLDITGPAGGNDYGCIWFFGFNPGLKPVTQPTGVAGRGGSVFIGG